MTINYVAVLVCAVAAMAVGFVWYGPLFGKKWMEVVGADPSDMEKRAEMQKSAKTLYVVQFVLAFIQVLILAFYTSFLNTWNAVANALIIWLAFVMPTVAAASMWNNESSKRKWARFLIQSGYYLVLFAVFGLILGFWK